MKKIISLLLLTFSFCRLYAQTDLSSLFTDSLKENNMPVIATFKSGILINAQTNETLHQHDLLFAVGHRFGDVGGSLGGSKTFYGLDMISDDLIGFEYGITNRLTVGVGRDKGATNNANVNQTQLWYGTLKYRLLQQTMDNNMPLSISLFGRGIISSMASLPTNNDAHFNNFKSRLSAAGQVIIARKFSDYLSLELLPTYIRRENVVSPDNQNMFAMGIGGRLKLTEHMAIEMDYFLPFRSPQTKNYFNTQDNTIFYNPLSVGLAIETGGHVFHIDFTNATSMMESQFIPGTVSNWTKGQFRWGFNFSRTFTIGKGGRKQWNK